MGDERGVSNVAASILIIILVVFLAVIAYFVFFSASPLQEKSAYIVPDFGTETLYTKNFIVLFHRGGDAVSLGTAGLAGRKLNVYIDTSSGSFPVEPVAGLDQFRPGSTVYIYYTTSGYQMTSDSSSLSAATAKAITACPLSVRLVDEEAKVLVDQWNQTDCIVTGPAPTVSAISNATGYRGWPVIESITGTNFLTGATAKFNRSGTADITAKSCKLSSSTQLVCTFDLAGKDPSPPTYNIVVTNPDGKSGMRTNRFTLSSNTPTLTGRSPTSALQAATVAVNLTGNYYQPGATVTYWQGSTVIPLGSVVIPSRTRMQGSLTIPSSAPTGTYNITIVNPDGKSVTRTGYFTVNTNAPTISGIAPATGYRGWPVTITALRGSRFQPGATVKLVNASAGADITAGSVVVFPNGTTITCAFDLAGVPAARRNVTVTNPDGKTGTRANAFTVSSPAPTITSSTPSSGVLGTTVAITNLAGTYFQPGATVTYWRGTTTIPLGSVAVPSRTQITGSLAIPAGAPTGSYNVTIVNTDGKSVTRTGRFTVYALPPPTISGISPGTGARGTSVPVVITGTYIVAGARVRLYNGTTYVYLAPLGTVTPPNQISTTFSVGTGVIPGTMNVRVTNPDGQYAILTGGYILT